MRLLCDTLSHLFSHQYIASCAHILKISYWAFSIPSHKQRFNILPLPSLANQWMVMIYCVCFMLSLKRTLPSYMASVFSYAPIPLYYCRAWLGTFCLQYVVLWSKTALWSEGRWFKSYGRQGDVTAEVLNPSYFRECPALLSQLYITLGKKSIC